MADSTNVLRDALSDLRRQHLARCRASLYWLTGWGLLLWAAPLIAAGLFLVLLGLSTHLRAAAQSGGSQ